MVTVPQYQPNVSLRPELRQNVDVRATPEMFGADIGRGMQNLGQGMAQASTAIAQVQALEDAARAKEADNQYASWARERMYGEGGYMTLQGRAAVDGRTEFEREAEERRKEFGSRLTGGAAQSYNTASNARLQQILQTSVVHTANERKTWFKDASESRLDTYAEDAVAAFNNPAKVNFNIAAGQAEIRQQAALFGWDADTLKNREAEYVSSVRLNTAIRMMSADPVAAKKYYDENKSQFTGPHQFNFEETLKVPLAAENVKRYTADFFSGSAGTNYYANIRAAESAGDDQARNPRSSATGRYQFTTGTWNDLMTKHPELGLTASGRTDPEQQERAIRVLTDNNAKSLAAGGVTVTNGTLYAAHFLGAGGATQVLRSAPEAKLTDILSAGVIEANPFLRGMTVADFSAWADRKGGGGSGGGVASVSQIEPFLAKIKDPNEREMTRKAIYAQIDAREKAVKAQQEAYKGQAFNLIETQNINPFQLPTEISTAIGMEGMSSLMSYWEKRQSGRAIETDPVVYHDLQMAYARDPSEFSQRDLFQYKGVLSDSDWRKVSEWKQTALTDQRKAREEGLTLTTAFSQAETQLAAVGISTVGKSGDDREASAKQIAMFNAALSAEMEAFKRIENRTPNQMDIQSMVNRLLLPVVVKEPSWSLNPFSGFSGTSERETFLFETGGVGALGANVSAELNFKYEDIPVTDRVKIADFLKSELGYAPSEEQVIAVYEQWRTQSDRVPTR